MRTAHILAALSAASLVTAPVVAQAATQPLPRDGSEIADAEGLAGGYIIPILAIAAIILGILAATGGGDDDPVSP